MDVLSIENFLLPLSSYYIGDADFTFTSRKVVSEEGFSLFKENYLLSAIDARINNYSSLYLTKKTLGEDIFTLKQQDSQTKTTIPVSLIIPDTNLALYASDSRGARAEVEFSTENDINTVFDLEIISNNVLRVAHQRGADRYYLSVVNGVFFFSSSSNTYPDTVFYYILNDEQLFLFKIKNDLKKVIKCSSGVLELTDAENFPQNYFTVRNFFQDISPQLNTAWVSYDSFKKNNLVINPAKSVSNIAANYLISNQYSHLTGSSIPTNFITLKNQHSNNDYNHRVNIVEKYDSDLPSINRREYTSIIAGVEQEKGNYNITLPYEFYTADFKFATDKYTTFKTPDSLYPFERININDAAINLAGAIGGDTPYTSDRIFYKDIDRLISDGQYLCTWLSASPGNPGIWLDRYYHPQKSLYVTALTSLNSNKQIDSIDSLLSLKLEPSAYYDTTYLYSTSSEELAHTPQSIQDALVNNFFFDKKSDLAFIPSTEYIYYRIGDSYVNSIIQSLSSALIQDGLSLKTSKNATINNGVRDIVFNNDTYSIVDSFREVNNTSQSTISFWIDSLDWTKPVGHQIIGNLNDRGFALINDPIITPLIQIQDTLKVINLNTNFEIINTARISPIEFAPIIKAVSNIDYIYSTITYFVTSYFIKDIVRTDHLDVYQPVVVSYSLSTYDRKSITDGDDGGGDGKVVDYNTCPVLLVDNPTALAEEKLLADNVKQKVGNTPLTGIIIEPCSF